MCAAETYAHPEFNGIQGQNNNEATVTQGFRTSAGTDGAPWGFELLIVQTEPQYLIINHTVGLFANLGISSGNVDLAVTYHLPNGARASWQVWTLQSDSTRLPGSPLQTEHYVPPIQPARITSFVSITPPTGHPEGGRHRTFSLELPSARGANLTELVIRRYSSTVVNAFEYDYVIPCPFFGGLISKPCSSSALDADTTTATAADAFCYDHLTCEEGATVTITVGSNLFPADTFYITPDQLGGVRTYGWGAIGERPAQQPCFEPS